MTTASIFVLPTPTTRKMTRTRTATTKTSTTPRRARAAARTTTARPPTRRRSSTTSSTTMSSRTTTRTSTRRMISTTTRRMSRRATRTTTRTRRTRTTDRKSSRHEEGPGHGPVQRRGLAVLPAVVPFSGGDHVDRDALLLQLRTNALLRWGRGARAERHDHRRPRRAGPLVVPLGRDVHHHHRMADHPAQARPARTQRLFQHLLRLGHLLRRHAGHSHVVQRLVRDLAGPAGDHRLSPPGRQGWHRHRRSSGPGPARGVRIPNEHDAVDPDALLHGRGQPSDHVRPC